ncbi:hypothetical protein TWF718_008812 [Orbilia javanica]|uniref:Uncharacterized protein n=1 Tax=Orbilia javanica TaxID=47235 RepID=A0AAN8MUW7_9PEZI
MIRVGPLSYIDMDEYGPHPAAAALTHRRAHGMPNICIGAHRTVSNIGSPPPKKKMANSTPSGMVLHTVPERGMKPSLPDLPRRPGRDRPHFQPSQWCNSEVL